MASNIEQFASSFNFGTLSKAQDLKKRIFFTLAALVVYRIGTYIPVPGIDPLILNDIFKQNAGGILSMFDMFAGGALGSLLGPVGTVAGAWAGEKLGKWVGGWFDKDKSKNAAEAKLLQQQN